MGQGEKPWNVTGRILWLSYLWHASALSKKNAAPGINNRRWWNSFCRESRQGRRGEGLCDSFRYYRHSTFGFIGLHRLPWDPSISWWTNYSSSFYNLINSNFSTVFLFFTQNVKISKSQETFRASCTKKKGKEKKERNKYSNSGRKGTIIGANGKRDLPRRIVGRRGEKEREGGESCLV